MGKSNSELLAALKKANKTRRLTMAQNAGFNTVEDYLFHLAGVTTGKGKETVHIVNILDVSSSMSGSKLEKALEGLNSEVDKLSNETNVDYIYSLITFSNYDRITTHHNRTPIKSIEHMRFGATGMTALNDAVGKVLTELKTASKKQKERVVVSIFTDGEENNSRRFSSTQVSALVEECESLGIIVTFIGTERDIKVVTRDLKIKASNTLAHDNTSKGVEASFRGKLNATVMYSKAVARGVSQDSLLTGFYSKKTGKL